MHDDDIREDIASDVPSGNALFALGHPGHELRILAWLARLRPGVAFLTDGSGGIAKPRIAQSEALIRRAGGTLVPTRPITDAAIYRALLECDIGAVGAWVDNLVEWLVRNKASLLVSDAAEGYNPTHDVCRFACGMVARLAQPYLALPLIHYEILLVGNPRERRGAGDAALVLPDDQLAAKIRESRGYAAAAGGMLVQEVDEALAQFGQEAFRDEVLMRCVADTNAVAAADKPFYETFGEKQVAAGRYEFVIRAREHVAPFMHRLEQQFMHAESNA